MDRRRARGRRRTQDARRGARPGGDGRRCRRTPSTRSSRAASIERVDFIKLDVEHFDLGVLQGAAETIRTQRPRLAISIYHRPDDLATIPAFVDSLGVAYRWYLQCSTMTDIDTVAFGVPI